MKKSALSLDVDDLEGGRRSYLARQFSRAKKALAPVGNELKSIGNATYNDVLKPAGQEIYNKGIKPAINDVVTKAKNELISGIQNGASQLISEAPMAALEAGAGHKKKRKLSAKMVKRNALMKELMKKGMGFAEASKYIKAKNLV